MNVYKKKGSGRRNNLIIFFTTSQSPHFEAGFDFYRNNHNLYKNIYFVDLITKNPYRHEFLWRNNVDFKTNIIRKFRNNYIKILFLKYFIYQNKFNKFTLKKIIPFKLSDEIIYSILKTYTMTEFRTSSLINNYYETKIIKSITYVSNFISTFLSLFKLNKNDTFLLFNGRHPVEFTTRILLNNYGYKKIIYHECNNYKPLIYFTNFQIHDLKSYYKNIFNYYNANSNLRLKYKKLKSIKIYNLKKKYISFFTSSFDEYAFADSKPINQSYLISELIKASKYLPIKIRVHPNTQNKSQQDKNYWNFLKNKFPNVIINYNERYDSYKLIQESLFTCSIGSSIAPESILLNVNHLICGNQHMYDKLTVFYKSSEKNFMKNIQKMYSSINSLKVIKESDRELAASSLLFMRDIGHKVKLIPFGKYPI